VKPLLRRLGAARSRPAGDDRGAATLFVIGLSVMLLVLAGLVVDGGLAINARANAADIAEQTARAGAQVIDEQALRDTGVVRLADDGSAADRAADFFASTSFASKQGADIEFIDVVGDEITVQVTRQYDTALLNLIGFKTFTVRAQASARPAVGIDDEL
jgi:Flp pilus assembly protein TadG